MSNDSKGLVKGGLELGGGLTSMNLISVWQKLFKFFVSVSKSTMFVSFDVDNYCPLMVWSSLYREEFLLSFPFGCNEISCNFESFVFLSSLLTNLSQIQSPCHGWLIFEGVWVSSRMEYLYALWSIEGMIPSTYAWKFSRHLSFLYSWRKRHILPWFHMYQCKMHNMYWWWKKYVT